MPCEKKLEGLVKTAEHPGFVNLPLMLAGLILTRVEPKLVSAGIALKDAARCERRCRGGSSPEDRLWRGSH